MRAGRERRRGARKTAAAAGTRKVEGVVLDVGGVLTSIGWPYPPMAVLTLSPWQEVGSPVQREPLRVEIPVANEKAVGATMARWDGQTVRVNLERVLRREYGRDHERHVARGSVRGIEPGPELRAVNAELERPRCMTTRLLGVLRFDRGFGWFAGRRHTGRLRYDFMIDVEDADDAGAVARARADADRIVREVERRLPVIRRYAAVRLLGVCNDVWREGRPLTPAAFQRRMRLATVAVASDRITLDFDGDGLFHGHGIEVRMSPQLEPLEAAVS